VRNQRGQIQQAATDRARRAAVTSAPTEAAPAAPTGPPQRGAFGQRAESDDKPAANNRTERRAQGKKK
jgi:preprotein translocase subunit SecA